MGNAIQLDLWGKTLAQEFDVWAHTPGGRHVCRDLYRIASRYATRYLRTGRRASMRLMWELERDQIVEVRARLRARGIDLAPWKSYALNDHHIAYAARHLEAHRPEWAGMFERREVGRPKRARPVFVKAGIIAQRSA
jgi:hypothetical protein